MADDERSTLLEELHKTVPDGGLRDDPESMAGEGVDETGRFGIPPLAVAEPSSMDEVAGLVELARRRGVPLVPRGGRTSLVGGSVPTRSGEIVVSTDRLDHIHEIDLDTGQIHVGAGVTLTGIEDALAATPWRYAIDFAARDTATIGGTVATDAGGPRVFRHGTTRDQLRGIAAVLGTGERVEHLRGLRKDNTGYDLAGLLCGSEGTLGIICEVRLRLIERRTAVMAAIIGFDDLDEATSTAWRIARRVVSAEEIELAARDCSQLVALRLGRTIPVEGEWLVFVRIAETTDQLAEQALSALGAAVGGHSTHMAVAPGASAAGLLDLRDGISDALRSRSGVHKYDVSLPATSLTRTLGDVRARLREADGDARLWLFGHVCDHNIHINITDATLSSAAIDELVLGIVIAQGGSISAEHGIGVAKAGLLPRNRDAGSIAAMERIKSALDPDGILNPGVLLAAPTRDRNPRPAPTIRHDRP